MADGARRRSARRGQRGAARRGLGRARAAFVARGLELDVVGVDAQVELGQGDGGGGEARAAADVQRAVAELGLGGQPRAGRVGGVDDHEDRDEVHDCPFVGGACVIASGGDCVATSAGGAGGPQTAAVVLSEMRAEVAASVLERLERGFAQTIVLRLSRVPTLDPPIAASIQGAIERDFLSVLQRNLSKRRPADLIAGLMNNISTEVREGFLSYLEAQEPSLAQDVQRTMFTFDDIAVRLHGRDVAGVLRDVAEEVLLKALKLGEAQSSATVGFVLENLPRRLAERYVEELAALTDVSRKEGEAAADRDHQGDPGPGQGRGDPLHREGQRLRLSARRTFGELVSSGQRLARGVRRHLADRRVRTAMSRSVGSTHGSA